MLELLKITGLQLRLDGTSWLLDYTKHAMAAWDDVIDFDDVRDWPMQLRVWLKLLNPPLADQEYRARIEQIVGTQLRLSRIRTYHCTRLLPSEVEAVKREGLRPASADLARDKREAASEVGRPLPFWAQDDPSNKIWFYHRRADLDAAISGALLRSWGGKELLASSRGIVDAAAKPYIIAFNYPVSKLKYVFGRSWCALDRKIINQYLAQSSSVSPEDTAFESCIDEPVPIQATEIILAGNERFGALTNYSDELHFHAA